MAEIELRITGLGGQGSVLMGYILGRAYSINKGNQATMIQSFGPEARGSSCSATLVLSENEVLYPYTRQPDYFVVMSGDGYDKYKEELAENGTLIYESDLVTPDPAMKQKAFGIPSIRIAEQIGNPIVQNIVMLGFASAAMGIIDREQMRAAVEASVPEGTGKLNLKAFDTGYDYYQQEYGS